MNSTRPEDSTFNQARHASSSEFKRGLLANLVAKRCALVDADADRELIWFIQYLSHQEGGLPAVVRALLAKYAERIGTPSMLEIGKGESSSYTAEEVHKVRMDLPPGYRAEYPLKGETRSALRKLDCKSQSNRFERLAKASAILERRRLENLALDAVKYCDASELEIRREEQRCREEAEEHPTSYPVNVFRELCRCAAVDGLVNPAGHAEVNIPNLERELSEMCLSPEWDFSAGRPWYFSRLVETLRDYQASFVANKAAGVVVTEIGKQVCEALDYTSYSRLLTLMQGEARTGKSFSARAWCEQHPGRARFVEVPPGNDEIGFFHALGRGLGLGNFANYSTTQMRERVESVLLTGDIMVVLDEAQRLWPRSRVRHGLDPKRIVWVMKWANDGVPIAMIATPQFIETQKAAEKCGWNSAQLTGRIGHYVALPAVLSVADLMVVASAVLPDADAQILRVLAAYAQESARYLAAIDIVSKRARWLADKAGRASATTEDVSRAMKESVMPSDTRLRNALASKQTRLPIAATEKPTPAIDVLPDVEAATPRNRGAFVATSKAAPAPRRANLTELVTD